MADNFDELQKLMNEAQGKHVVFDKDDKPQLIVLDARKYGHLILDESGQDKKTVLVTGGAGYIGSHVARELSEQGFRVVVLDNLSTGHIQNVAAELIVGDLTDRNLLDQIFAKHEFDAVLHFAGSIIVSESMAAPHEYFLNNVAASINLLHAMNKHGVSKLIYSSSAAVYGEPSKVPISESHAKNPTSAYGESKLMFEQILQWQFQATKLSSVSLRYFNAAGATPEKSLGENHPQETHLIPKILDVANRRADAITVFGSDYPTPDGTAVRDYIHVRDLAHAHVLALNKLTNDSGCFAYNVGTGRGYSVAQIIDAVIEQTSKMVTIERAARRAGDPPELVADVSKIKAELGFEPEHSELQNIIATAWEWHKIKDQII